MEQPKRIFINTIAQYVKAIINTCLSLYTVRLILSSLGQSDYGIYSLVAGIVAMLGFVINAMVITTQRYLSYYQGKQDYDRLCKYFSNSFALHLIIGSIASILLFLLKDYLCGHFLNIAEERRYAAGIVYTMTVLMLMISFISTPFKAALIAHENIVYISIIEIIDGFMKLSLAVVLLDLQADKLIVYSFIMMCIYLFELLAFSIFSIKKYGECRPTMFLKDFDTKIIRELGGFAKWTTYGMGAVLLRTQGLSVLFNKFFGTVLNASYGIALQVFGAVSFISSSLINAMNPVMMRYEGQNNRLKTLRIAEQESKFTIAMMSLFFIPLIIEMDEILRLWLKEVPPSTAFLCRCLLVSFLVDQSTYGLNSVNQAIGRIRNYTLLMYTPKLLFLPVAFGILYSGYDIGIIMLLFILIELLVAMMRLPYTQIHAGLNIKEYCRNVFMRLFPMIGITACASWLVSTANLHFRLIYVCATSFIIGCTLIWLTVLTKKERDTITDIFITKKIC